MRLLPVRRNQVIVKIDPQQKQYQTLAGGIEIKLMRHIDSVDEKYHNQTRGIIVSGGKLKEGTHVLLDHNAYSKSHILYGYIDRDEEGNITPYKYISIDQSLIYGYLEDGEWYPCEEYDFALYVYTKKKSSLDVKPSILKDCFYMLTGAHKNSIVKCATYSNYLITIRDDDGKDRSFLRIKKDDVIAIYNEIPNDVSHWGLNN